MFRILFYTKTCNKNLIKYIFLLTNNPKCDFINFQYNSLEKYFFLDIFVVISWFIILTPGASNVNLRYIPYLLDCGEIIEWKRNDSRKIFRSFVELYNEFCLIYISNNEPLPNFGYYSRITLNYSKYYYIILLDISNYLACFISHFKIVPCLKMFNLA